MATIDGTLLEFDTLTQNANVVKNLVLAEMYEQHLINEAQYKELHEKWQVICIKNGWFKTWAKVFNKDENQYSYKFVQFEK